MNENPPQKVDYARLKREILASEPRVTRFKINWTNQGEKYSIADSAVENAGCNVASGLTNDQIMMGADENLAPNVDTLRQAAQGSLISNRMEALLSGLNENSNGPGAFGSNTFKPGYGTETYETSMDGLNAN